MAGKGGARKGAGRKTIAQEQKAVERIKKALRSIYNIDDDDEAINAFLMKFGSTKEGMKFFAEHLLGKPEVKVDATSNGETISNPVILFGTNEDNIKP